LVPVNENVKSSVIPQPVALPDPCAERLPPGFTTAEALWNVKATEEHPVDCTGSQVRLPVQDALFPVPCTVSVWLSPMAGQMFDAVALLYGGGRGALPGGFMLTTTCDA
jgi:hypothetical protein